MNWPEKITEKLKNMPRDPGVYIMRDKGGKPLYVGKATVLRNRVRSYFQAGGASTEKIRAMLSRVHDLETITTRNEVEALVLETNLIKQYRPRFNVLMRDDKRYPFIKISFNEDFPRVLVRRQVKNDGGRYFGPYPPGAKIHETVRLLRRLFPVRSCKYKSADLHKVKACLDFQIGRCDAPCEGKISREDYRAICDDIVLFLEGRNNELTKKLEARMAVLSDDQRFEEAARIRDQIQLLERIQEKQTASSPRLENEDVIALAREGSIACAALLAVRAGKVVGRDQFFLQSEGTESDKAVLSQFIAQHYEHSTFVPGTILTGIEPEDSDVLTRWLSEKRGFNVELRVPQRGTKVKLLELADKNAHFGLEAEIRRLQEKSVIAFSPAVTALQEALNLEKPPFHIEAFDISNIQGTDPVGSMVYFSNGLPNNKRYRHFKIKTVKGIDDFAMMHEVVQRRYMRMLDEGQDLPDLILIDGGKGQLGAACAALEEIDLYDLPIIGLAKKYEEIFRPGNSDPLILPKGSAALTLLQRIRDEAHRFAVTFHRKLRSKRIENSELDAVPGIGKKRKAALIKRFGSIDKIRTADPDKIAETIKCSRAMAERVLRMLS